MESVLEIRQIENGPSFKPQGLQYVTVHRISVAGNGNISDAPFNQLNDCRSVLNLLFGNESHCIRISFLKVKSVYPVDYADENVYSRVFVQTLGNNGINLLFGENRGRRDIYIAYDSLTCEQGDNDQNKQKRCADNLFHNSEVSHLYLSVSRRKQSFRSLPLIIG